MQLALNSGAWAWILLHTGKPLSFDYTCELAEMKPTLARERKSISPQYW